MQRVWVGVLLGFASPATSVAQDFAARLADVDRRIQAREWLPALTVLLPMGDAAVSDEERLAVAKRLVDVGERLTPEGALEPALQAYEAALAIRRHVHGEADHLETSRCLNNVAFCLHNLGKPAAALP